MSSGQFSDNASAPTPSTGEIVVGLDGSLAAAAAMHWAAEQARVTGSRLRAVHAWRMSAFGVAANAAGAAQFVEAASADARARATRWALDALDKETEIRWQLDIVEGSPGPALVARSHGAQLLVLGTQEHTGLQRAINGSVSHYCLTHADTPVVAVPTLSEAPMLVSSRDRFTTLGPLL
jgi:nucleotide-binding universal stress UspA family protein